MGEQIANYMQKAADNGYSGAVLLSIQGQTVISQGFGLANREKKIAFTNETVFDIGSITKQFTGAAILKLEMQGKLSVNDKISKYLPGVPDDKKEITIHHLLTHSAGMPDALGGDEELIDQKTFLKAALEEPLIGPLGEYEYSNVGYSLFAILIEKISKKDYEKYLFENLFKPADMMQTGYTIPKWDKNKLAIGYRGEQAWGITSEKSQYQKGVTYHLRGNGGIMSTVEDMHKWFQALKGENILSNTAKEKYFGKHISEGEEDAYYGYGWANMKSPTGEEITWHNGGNGFFNDIMAFNIQNDWVIIVSANVSGKITDNYAKRILQIADGNYEPLDEKIIPKYSGTYQFPSGVEMQVGFNENDELIVLLDKPELFRFMSGTSFDKPEEAKKKDDRLKEVLNFIKSGDFVQFAEARMIDMPKEEFAKNAKMYWDGVLAESGKIKDIEILGSVSRRQGQLYITAARIICEKKTLDYLFIWEGDKIADLRSNPEGQTKSFEPDRDNQFISPSNNASILLSGEKGVPALVIESKGEKKTVMKK